MPHLISFSSSQNQNLGMQVSWSKQDLNEEQVKYRLEQLIEQNQQVMSLDLSYNQLESTGFLNQIFQNSFLQKTVKILNLSNNKLESVQLDNLSGLFSLDLSFNSELNQVDVFNLPGLRALDVRCCAIDGTSLLNMLERPQFVPKNLRLSGNMNITDEDIEIIIQHKDVQQKIANLTSLDLKNTGTQKYQILNHVLKALPEGVVRKKGTVSVQPLKPVETSSRRSSAKPLPHKAHSPADQIDQIVALKHQSSAYSFSMSQSSAGGNTVHGAEDHEYPQALVEILVGDKYKIYNQVPGICSNANVCAAVVAGCKVQMDMEEIIAFGFARKFGTVFCKARQGAQYDCKERCSHVLTIIQKKTSELNEEAGKETGDEGLVVRGREM